MIFRILILCVFLKAGIVFSQNSISGKIVDESNEPLPFANIVLYDTDTDKFVAGTVSDDDGNYLLSNILDGNFLLEVSVLGFENQKSESFVLSDKTKVKVLDWVLKEETKGLKEVVVKAKRPVIRQTAEKLIVDMERSEMVNSNLQDVMKKVPGIIVTNGNITYGGQQGIRILLNGKTTDYFDLSSLLRDLPADNIAKIELIQQPGAEYDAAGSGPLLNIILKKNIKIGTNGNIKLFTGYNNNDPEYGLSGAIASYKNKLNWQLSGGYRQSAFREDLLLNRKVKNDVYNQSTISPFNPVAIRLNSALHYYANEKNTFGIEAGLINRDSERVASTFTDVTGVGSAYELLTENDFDLKRNILNINPYYTFDDKKNRLTLDFNFIDYNTDNINNIYTVGENAIGYNNQRYLQDGKYQIFTYKGDYNYTVNEDLNWKFGAKFSMVDTDSDLSSYVENEVGGFVLDKVQSNRFLVDENIFALYSKVVKSWEKWTISGGLRWENSNTEGTSTNPNETKSRKISRLFPSASITRKLNDTFGANLSYSYRILRPSYNSLNSFVYYYDPFTFEQGNPNLKPEFTNSFQFNLTFNKQPFFSISYKNSTDALFELVTQNDITAQTARSVINLAERKNWNFRAFAPVSFLKGLGGFSGFIVNYNEFKSANLTPKLNLDKWSLTWYTSLEYELPWEINSELTGYYITGGLQGQLDHDWLASISFALSKKFIDDKLEVNLGIGEILNRKFEGSLIYDNIDGVIISDWSRQDIYIQLTYGFGSKFNKVKKRKNSSLEEQNRIKKNK